MGESANDRRGVMLPSELLTHDVGASFRSAWGTLQHIAWGEWLWLGRWQGRASSGTNPLDCPDLQTLTLHWAELEHEQTEFLRRFSGPGRSAVKRAGAFAS
jgi:uncharacterized damage-inducible protein DinB